MIEESWLIPVLKRLSSPPSGVSLAIDVGANVGAWSAMLADIYESVIAIEPDARVACVGSPHDRVEIHLAAASDFCGSVVLHRRLSALQNSLLESHPIDDSPVIDSFEVPCVTLDNLCPGGADFVKIDVEGAEVAVLRGCSGDRWNRAAFIVECHDTFQDVKAELARLGKTVEQIPHPLVSHPGHCWAVGTPNDSSQPVV